jgi:predicted PurR-regulated permease PerM
LQEGKARSRLAYRVVGLVLALLLGIYFIHQIPQLVLLFLLTILFAIVLSGPVNYLARMGLPRGGRCSGGAREPRLGALARERDDNPGN